MAKYLFGGRSELKKAAHDRWLDAKVLRQQKRWRGAVYLAGYTVECEIKVKLMEMYKVRNLQELQSVLTKRFRKEVNLRTHSIEYLFEFTKARVRLDSSKEPFRAFHGCNQWGPEWRYSPEDPSEDFCENFFRQVEVFRRFIEGSV